MNPTSSTDAQQLKVAQGKVIDTLLVLAVVLIVGGIAAFSWKVAIIAFGLLCLAEAIFIANGGMDGIRSARKRDDGTHS